MSNWPTHSDYQDAMQNPSVCFAEQELKAGEPRLDMLGLPRVMSGNFASVYELKTAEHRWAIRCFVRQVPGQQGRYARLSQYLNNLKMSCLVDFEYILKGILVKGEWYPIVKMRWVDGSPLNTWVEENLNNPEALTKLAADWRVMMKDLADNKVAHGDLQHGNIMVTPQNELRLVDYDGMYAPVFGRGRAPELGHVNFQHPRRTADFYQEDLDNFSALVIYTSLLALASEPDLWQKFYTVDNLILLSSDYKNPLNSQALERLKKSKDPKVPLLASLIEKSCLAPVENVPDFLAVMEALDNGTLDALPMKTPAPGVSFSRPAPASTEPATGSRPAASGSRSSGGGTRSAYDHVQTVATQPLRKSQPVSPRAPGFIPPPEPDKSSGVPGWVWGAAGALVALAIILVVMNLGKKPEPDTEPVRPPVGEPVESGSGSAPAVALVHPAVTPVNLKTTLLVALKGHSGSVDVLQFSPSGKLLASGSSDKTVRIWNAQTGQPRRVLGGSTEAISSVAFLPDEQLVCAIGMDKIIRFFEVESGALKKQVDDFKDNLFPVVFSPDGRSLAAGASNDPKTVRVVDPLLGTTIQSFPSQSSWVKAVSISPNGKMLVALRHDETLSILDLGSGKMLHALNVAGNAVEAPAFSRDNKWLALGSDGRSAKVVDTASGAALQTFNGHSGEVKCCAFSPDGKLLATGSTDNTVKIWDVVTGAEKQTLAGHSGTVNAVVFSADGTLLATGSADQSIRLYDVKR